MAEEALAKNAHFRLEDKEGGARQKVHHQAKPTLF